MTRQHFGDGEPIDVPRAVPLGVLLPRAAGPAGPEQEFAQVGGGCLPGRSGTGRQRPGGITAGNRQPRFCLRHQSLSPAEN